MGTRLTGKERDDSLAAGSDGVVAQFDGGYLDAGQGTEGRLNLTGSALTIAVRLRNSSACYLPTDATLRVRKFLISRFGRRCGLPNTELVFLRTLSVECTSGSATLRSLQLFPLRSIWNEIVPC